MIGHCYRSTRKHLKQTSVRGEGGGGSDVMVVVERSI